MLNPSIPYLLDQTDRKILVELDRDCRISMVQLSKKVRKSREVVTYRIAKLQEDGIITGFITSINPHKFGYSMFKVYLKLDNIPKERERFFASLKSNQNVYWMGICDGAYDCVLALLSKDVVEYHELVHNLLFEWKHLIISRVLGTMVDTKQLTKRFFVSSSLYSSFSSYSNGEYVTFGGHVESFEIDDLDRALLRVLAHNARMPLLQLAHSLHSTVEIVRRRMYILVQRGIILQYRVALDLNKLGFEFFKAIIYCKSLSRSDEASLLEWMRQQSKSLYYIRTLGVWELEFEFAVENYVEFNSIMRDLRERFPHIIRNYEHLLMIEEKWMPGYDALIGKR